VLSQSAALGQIEFEAASVKISRDQSAMGSIRRNPGRIDYEGIPLRQIVADAYGIQMYRVAGPGWVYSTRFDIIAVTPPGTSPAQQHSMLQTLLSRRLQMKIHYENKLESVYLVTVAEGGLKMQKLSPDGEDAHYPIRADIGPSKSSFSGKMPILTLISGLQRSFDRRLVDQTGLEGWYLAKFAYSFPEPLAVEGPGDARMRPAPDMDLFRAIQEQLGLEIKPTEMKTQSLVIDHVDKTPTGN
jgi:uncharacterized protein (TIGR03435 family)